MNENLKKCVYMYIRIKSHKSKELNYAKRLHGYNDLLS